MRIFFVRHGESEANTRRIFSNRGDKFPLTERGRGQADKLAQKIASVGINCILTSPIRRAVETAEIVGAKLGIVPELEPALREWDVGIYEDRPHEEGAQAYSEVEQQWIRGNLDARLPSGESCSEIHDRFVPMIERIVKKHGADENSRLLLVGHGGTFRHALPRVLCNVTPEFAMSHGLDNTSYVEAELSGGTLRCVQWSGETF